jgi:hypothetical protein
LIRFHHYRECVGSDVTGGNHSLPFDKLFVHECAQSVSRGTSYSKSGTPPLQRIITNTDSTASHLVIGRYQSHFGRAIKRLLFSATILSASCIGIPPSVARGGVSLKFR